MFELDQETDNANILPMYIAMAPRDPRDGAPQSPDAISYLGPVTTEELAEQLIELSIPAQIIDGAVIGAPGWVIARTLGFEDGSALRWAPEENTTGGRLPSVGFEQVAADLANALGTHCHISDSPALPSIRAHVGDHVVDLDHAADAVVGHFTSVDGPLLAHAAGVDLWFAHRPDWSIITGRAEGLDVDTLLTWVTPYPTVAFERDGQYRRISVAIRGHIVITHEWGPEWAMVDPRATANEHLARLLDDGKENAADLVIDYFEPATAQASDFLPYFDLDPVTQDRLDLVLNSPEMDDPLTAFARILGLPVEAAEIAEGWRSPETLPGVTHAPVLRLPYAVWSAATTVPTENTFAARISRMWLTRPPAYYVVNTTELLTFTAAAALAHKRGHTKTAVALGALAVVTAADFFVPRSWRGHTQR